MYFIFRFHNPPARLCGPRALSQGKGPLPFLHPAGLTGLFAPRAQGLDVAQKIPLHREQAAAAQVQQIDRFKQILGPFAEIARLLLKMERKRSILLFYKIKAPYCGGKAGGL
ncbi:MAG: hypothetical protein LUD69_03665 [Oscillospiraceae bacterium]|nr:hypothetical protein [Oscillospiraceae bacterium]